MDAFENVRVGAGVVDLFHDMCGDFPWVPEELVVDSKHVGSVVLLVAVADLQYAFRPVYPPNGVPLADAGATQEVGRVGSNNVVAFLAQ